MKTSPIRKTQLIFNSGPGAIVETSDWSGVVSSIKEWDLSKLSRIPRKSRRGLGQLVRPPVISSKIGIEHYTPYGIVPVRRFPLWVQCTKPSCSVFGPFWHVKSQKDEFKCIACSSKLVPARLIRICPKGHIDDFPWEQFYHEAEACNQPHPKMSLVASDNQTGALGDLKIFCKCNKHPDGLSLANIYSFPLGKGCTGNSPWIEKDFEKCTEKSLVVLRGASNVYFPEIKSEITIPSHNEKFQRFLEEDLEQYHEFLEHAEDKQSFLKNPAIQNKIKLKSIAENDFVTYLNNYFSSDTNKETSERDIRSEEYRVLIDPKIVREDIIPNVFSANNIEVTAALKMYRLSSVVKINRLQEIRILQGFRRVFPNSNNGTVELIDFGKESDGIYPATEVNGEGIFFSLDENSLAKWERDPLVISHCAKIVDSFSSKNSFRDIPFEISPRSILLHTLAHTLIKQMALYGGYSSVSIREKIYAFNDANGILLYTGESDSEGTMGGIVSMCEPLKIQQLFEEAISESKWCSSDPVCFENAHDLKVSQNLAACHACVYLSETSCELSNKYLDRGVLIGDDVGFFKDL